MPASTPFEKPTRLPELLAPAGDWECARAAVENGADAIYFGLDRFNARMRARNFTESDLPKLMEFLGARGVKGYVTFNTLVFPEEMAEAEQYLRSIISAGVDAAIVQDIGICRLIREISADFPIHSSTQMTITSAAGVAFARDLGVNLVVLARECSIKEIKAIQAETASALPLEVFVHGALCVAYSGQCLTSEALGGRSANRGECAQACRMPYELISDGKQIPLGDKRYLLSPQDLAGLEVLPELIGSGVASLKIEGRLKTPEYVANITRVYRQALDRAATVSDPESGAEAAQSRYDLEMGFSRGLSTGWFRGINNQSLVHARFGKKRGVYLGEIKQVDREQVRLALLGPLKLGDGVVFDAGRPDHDEEGGRIYSIENRGTDVLIGFGHGNVDFSRVAPGQKLWKTSDPELDRKLRQTYAGEAPKFTRPLMVEVHGLAGEPLTVIARDEEGHVVQAQSAMPLQPAEKLPLDTERLRAQLGRLGGTPFQLSEIKNQLQGAVVLPVSELNRLRRQLVSDLDKLRKQPKKWQLQWASNPPPVPPSRHKSAELIVLVRNLDQLAAVLGRIRTIYCEFEDPKKYREAVQMARNSGDTEIWLAPPRIYKSGEEWILNQVRGCDPDGFLVRNYDHLKFFAGSRQRGDFSLNVANWRTADYFIRRFGLERVTASYDLNAGQLQSLLRTAPPSWFEITIHQHMPMFHMEHCVFCAFLSQGTDYSNCGRPCDKHRVSIRDRVGAEHPLKADAGCRNTVFNSRAQTGAEYLDKLSSLGARSFRVDFLNESAQEVQQTLGKYQQIFRGEISGAQLWSELKLINQLGVTRGQLGGNAV